MFKFSRINRRIATGAGIFPEYDKTISNMLINKHSKVICQGLTGKQVEIVFIIFIRICIGDISYQTCY